MLYIKCRTYLTLAIMKSHSESTQRGMYEAHKSGKYIGRLPKFMKQSKSGKVYISAKMKPFIEWLLVNLHTLVKSQAEFLSQVIEYGPIPKGIHLTVQDLNRILECPMYYGWAKYRKTLRRIPGYNPDLQELYPKRLKVRKECEIIERKLNELTGRMMEVPSAKKYFK